MKRNKDTTVEVENSVRQLLIRHVQNGYTLTDIAAKIGSSRTWVSAIHTGRRTRTSKPYYNCLKKFLVDYYDIVDGRNKNPPHKKRKLFGPKDLFFGTPPPITLQFEVYVNDKIQKAKVVSCLGSLPEIHIEYKPTNTEIREYLNRSLEKLEEGS